MSSRGSVWTGVKTQMWDCRSRTWWCFWSSARLRLHWGVSLERRDTRPVFFREQCNRNLSIWWKMLQSTGRSVTHTHTHIKADIIKWFFFNLAKTCWVFFFFWQPFWIWKVCHFTIASKPLLSICFLLNRWIVFTCGVQWLLGMALYNFFSPVPILQLAVSSDTDINPTLSFLLQHDKGCCCRGDSVPVYGMLCRVSIWAQVLDQTILVQSWNFDQHRTDTEPHYRIELSLMIIHPAV